jgi:hypothetical protein
VLRPLKILLKRSGILSYFRDQWRAEDASNRQALKAYASRKVEASVSSLRAEFRRLQTEQRMQTESNAAELSDRLRALDRDLRRLRTVLEANAAHPERRHGAAFDADRAAAHVTKAIGCATVQPEPMAHIVVNSFLPDDLYQSLLDAIPPDSCFTQRDMTKQNFRPDAGALAPEFTVDAWRFVEERVIDAAAVPGLLRLFTPHIDAAYAQKYGRHASAVAALPHGATAGRLMLRRPGYHLDAHLDPSRVIVTCLLYLARTGESEAFGTQFFRLTELPAVDRTNTYFPAHHGYACEMVKTVPFRPNTAVAFVNFGAAHGADIPADAPKDTKRYAYQFYVSPDPAAVSAIVGGPPDTAED